MKLPTGRLRFLSPSLPVGRRALEQSVGVLESLRSDDDKFSGQERSNAHSRQVRPDDGTGIHSWLKTNRRKPCGSESRSGHMKIWGPYLHKNGRMYVVIRKSNGKKGSMSLARFRMQQHLGRTLEKWEHVDHINGDFTDDRLENLQILTQAANNRKDRKQSWVYFECDYCLDFCREVPWHYKRNKHHYCSQKCAKAARKK